MAVHTIFALIDGQDVKNIIVGEYYDCNIIAKDTYGKSAFAVEVTQTPVQIGDIYSEGSFYRKDGETGEFNYVSAVPTMQQQYNYLEQQYNSLLELVITNELAMVDIMKGGN